MSDQVYMVDSGWRVTFADGVFAKLTRPLLADRRLDDAPQRLNVYLCPCCDQVVAMTLDDPRNADVGRAPVVYELCLAAVRAPRDQERFAVYEQAAA